MKVKSSKPLPISEMTRQKAELAKKYIEQKYQKNFEIEKRMQEYYDNIINRMQELEFNEQDRQIIQNEIMTHQVQYLREKRIKESILDYEPVTIIGRGAFGEVRLCKHLPTGEYVAVKKMRKDDMAKKNQLNHIRAERDLLATANTNWIVALKSSFTDNNNLYLVMEYLPGGDLMNLLIEKDIFTEDQARFYIAESILAVESVHNMQYIHRDLKPDNILLDAQGHIKLTDFGLCKLYAQDHRPGPESRDRSQDLGPKNSALRDSDYSRDHRGHKKVYSMVGTVDYIAPEVFGNEGYTETVDWWSLGTILFEMLMGYPPFYGKDQAATCKKVRNFRQYFDIPRESQISPEARDFLCQMITEPEHRLGRNGVQEIKAHPFFNKINWSTIRSSEAPFPPRLKSQIDTSNFEKIEENEPWASDENSRRRQKYKDYFWIGYTFKRPKNFENPSELEEIFERLKKKKEAEKRPFSEEKLDKIFPIKSLNVTQEREPRLLLGKKDPFPAGKYGFELLASETPHDPPDKLYQSLTETDKKKANFIKKLNQNSETAEKLTRTRKDTVEKVDIRKMNASITEKIRNLKLAGLAVQEHRDSKEAKDPRELREKFCSVREVKLAPREPKSAIAPSKPKAQLQIITNPMPKKVQTMLECQKGKQPSPISGLVQRTTSVSKTAAKQSVFDSFLKKKQSKIELPGKMPK